MKMLCPAATAYSWSTRFWARISAHSHLYLFMFTHFFSRSLFRRRPRHSQKAPPPPEPHDPLKHQVFVLDTHWRDGLEDILFGDPIPNLYPIEHYVAVPLPESAPRIPLQHYQGFVGCARGDTLCCVVLVGSNVVPVRLCCAYEEVPGGSDCTSEGSVGALHRDALAQLLLQVGGAHGLDFW